MLNDMQEDIPCCGFVCAESLLAPLSRSISEFRLGFRFEMLFSCASEIALHLIVWVVVLSHLKRDEQTKSFISPFKQLSVISLKKKRRKIFPWEIWIIISFPNEFSDSWRFRLAFFYSHRKTVVDRIKWYEPKQLGYCCPRHKIPWRNIPVGLARCHETFSTRLSLVQLSFILSILLGIFKSSEIVTI